MSFGSQLGASIAIWNCVFLRFVLVDAEYTVKIRVPRHPVLRGDAGVACHPDWAHFEMCLPIVR